MDWILVAVVAGGVLTSTHPSREACEGRVFTLKEEKILGKCVEAPRQPTYFLGSSNTIQVYGTCHTSDGQVCRN